MVVVPPPPRLPAAEEPPPPPPPPEEDFVLEEEIAPPVGGSGWKHILIDCNSFADFDITGHTYQLQSLLLPRRRMHHEAPQTSVERGLGTATLLRAEPGSGSGNRGLNGDLLVLIYCARLLLLLLLTMSLAVFSPRRPRYRRRRCGFVPRDEHVLRLKLKT